MTSAVALKNNTPIFICRLVPLLLIAMHLFLNDNDCHNSPRKSLLSDEGKTKALIIISWIQQFQQVAFVCNDGC